MLRLFEFHALGVGLGIAHVGQATAIHKTPLRHVLEAVLSAAVERPLYRI